VQQREAQLYYGDTLQINATTSTGTILFFPENIYHATVSEAGLVIAGFVGETNIVLATQYDTARVNIKVQPRYTLYVEPDLRFGVASKSDIIAKYGNSYTIDEGGLIVYQTTQSPYLPPTQQSKTSYGFDSDEMLTGVSVWLDNLGRKEALSFLKERYYALNADDDTAEIVEFVNGIPEKTPITMLINAYPSSFGCLVYYALSGN
jgi:hypothetical protein